MNKLLFLLLITPYLCISKTYTGKVIGIKDGDTVVVLDSLNYQTTLRLAEVDCPEKSQAFGTKAKQFTSDDFYDGFMFADAQEFVLLFLKVLNNIQTNEEKFKGPVDSVGK